MTEKVFNVTYSGASSKYWVSYYDGISKHPDGSDFYSLHIVQYKNRLKIYTDNLKSNGYKEKSI